MSIDDLPRFGVLFGWWSSGVPGDRSRRFYTPSAVVAAGSDPAPGGVRPADLVFDPTTAC
jgi:hypothetical protein